jgi:hypothetical protein
VYPKIRCKITCNCWRCFFPAFEIHESPLHIQEIWPSHHNSSNIFPYAFRPNLVIIRDTTVKYRTATPWGSDLVHVKYKWR